ncbi:BZ3500_MvSof-1268-A1-R1_Chr2-2g04827 [Microbotryum saponariae]|uniref:BZ3500_MvSof-1268-A1-R1_Chr2-2g04827 protein n=1 Tax=Microbotryum saponariae TaxID=289078 RepID=A0A2X0KMR7_9BASI|nr:BZ3500_MvSof-1268-A1-R1_Chr2-2g04827 [Microbotryum saponariae]SDA00264.1 BZ3501_MvSof-1269-A2-R1_Chr2-2g04501 [Microbotryum saponariae]
MVNFKLLLASALPLTTVLAFPQYAAESRGLNLAHFEKTVDDIIKRANIPQLHADARERRRNKRAPTFSESQLVDITGVHAFKAPGASDTRGPCPGLNVLSNHGYFARNGNTNLVESISALVEVFNMGVDTAVSPLTNSRLGQTSLLTSVSFSPAIQTVLVAYSIAIIGDPIALTWSIGRSPDKSTLLPGILSAPGGIDQSHNNYESDASVTRGDSFLTNGDVWSVQIDKFKALYNLQPDPATADYTRDILVQHRNFTIQQSISTNPNFYFAPWSGLVVATAAHNFVAHFFANHSASRPEGYLDQSTLKSFFSIVGDTPETFTWVPGEERIPSNWYKPSTPYTLVDVVTEVVAAILAVPAAGKIGGNTGKVNSFVGVDVANVTGGVLNAQTLLEGNNLFCFAYATARAGVPTILGGLVSTLGQTLGFLDSKLAGILPQLGCPQLDKLNLDAFNQFPGRG